MSVRRRVLRIGAAAAALVLVAAAASLAWAARPAPPMPEALAALASDDAVTVTAGRWVVFEPASGPEIGRAHV